MCHFPRDAVDSAGGKIMIRASIAAIVLLCFSIAIHGQQSSTVTNEVLRRAGTTTDSMSGDWLSYGRTQGETRYSPLKQIDSGNADRLGLAWSYAMGAGGGNQEGTPLMWNNTLYGITTWSVVFALDARTGT